MIQVTKEEAQQVLDALVSSTGELHLHLASPTDMQLVKNHKAIQTLRARLAEKEQEPVATLFGSLPVYDTAPPQQQNQFNPDWDAMAVMVEEQQRMAKRIEELEAKLKEKNT